MEQKFTRWIGVLLLWPALCRAGFDVTPSDNLTVGPDKYRSNLFDLELAPAETFSADLSVGNTNTTTPTADTTKQIGGNLWWQAGETVSLSLNVDSFTGQKASIIDARSGDVLGDADKRIGNLVWGPTIGIKLLRPDQDDDTPKSVRLDLGVNIGRQIVPLYVGTSSTNYQQLKTRAGTPVDYVTKDVEPTIAVMLKRGPASLNLSYARHHYTDNLDALESAGRGAGTSPLRRFILGNILYGIQNNVATAVQGQPKYDSFAGLTHKFFGDWAATVSYDYQDMEAPGQIARTTTVSLSWDAAKWTTVKLGTYWLNQLQKTQEYETAGVSFYF